MFAIATAFTTIGKKRQPVAVDPTSQYDGDLKGIIDATTDMIQALEVVARHEIDKPNFDQAEYIGDAAAMIGQMLTLPSLQHWQKARPEAPVNLHRQLQKSLKKAAEEPVQVLLTSLSLLLSDLQSVIDAGRNIPADEVDMCKIIHERLKAIAREMRQATKSLLDQLPPPKPSQVKDRVTSARDSVNAAQSKASTAMATLAITLRALALAEGRAGHVLLMADLCKLTGLLESGLARTLYSKKPQPDLAGIPEVLRDVARKLEKRPAGDIRLQPARTIALWALIRLAEVYTWKLRWSAANNCVLVHVLQFIEADLDRVNTHISENKMDSFDPAVFYLSQVCPGCDQPVSAATAEAKKLIYEVDVPRQEHVEALDQVACDSSKESPHFDQPDSELAAEVETLVSTDTVSQADWLSSNLSLDSDQPASALTAEVEMLVSTDTVRQADWLSSNLSLDSDQPASALTAEVETPVSTDTVRQADWLSSNIFLDSDQPASALTAEVETLGSTHAVGQATRHCLQESMDSDQSVSALTAEVETLFSTGTVRQATCHCLEESMDSDQSDFDLITEARRLMRECKTLEGAKQYSELEELSARIIEMLLPVASEYSPLLAGALHFRGSACWESNQRDNGIQYFEQALAIRKRWFSENNFQDYIHVWELYNSLTGCYFSAGRTNDARQCLQDALTSVREHGVGTHPRELGALSHLMRTYWWHDYTLKDGDADADF